MLALITLVWRRLPQHRWVSPVTILFTGGVAITQGLEAFGLTVPMLSNICRDLPWAAEGFQWVSPAIGGFFVGLFSSWKIPHCCDPS